MMTKVLLRRSSGFTLIEVIVMITLGALIAAMVVPLMGTALRESSAPLNQIVAAGEVNAVMETVAAAYRKQVEEGTLSLPIFKGGLSGYEADGVTVTGTYSEYRRAGQNLSDFNADGIYDPLNRGNIWTAYSMLLVKATKNQLTLIAVFGQ